MSTINFVTGVNEGFFDQLLLLTGSIRRHCPGVKLWVCDFGMTDQQRALLRRKGTLLEMPSGLGPFRHSWYYKAALGQYVDPLGDGPLLWIDADMILMSDIRPALDGLLAEMERDGDVLAATADSTIAGQMGTDPPPHYAALVSGLDQSAWYLSSGFFLCRSKAFLDGWKSLCLAMPFEMLFEQNAFNVVAMTQLERVRIIEHTWNVCGHDVRGSRIERSADNLLVTGQDGRAKLLHATSRDRGRDLTVRLMTLTFGDRTFTVTVRMFSSPDVLLELQENIVMETIRTDLGLFAELGFGSTD